MSRPDRSISQRLDRAGSIGAQRETLLEWIDDLEAEQKRHRALAIKASIALAKASSTFTDPEDDPAHHLIAAAYYLDLRLKALRKIVGRIEVMK
ncbi:MAG: hypothetical protein Q8L20_10870 [Gammaproteobacteria bacterium]|nr:hypothetical protein [Gammaproteobacteria bacterium]